MPLDTIYLTRHGHRLNWTIDYKTGTYSSQFPTPTGNPSDPTLTSHGVRQAHELAAHLLSENVTPKPFRIYSSPFWRCLQTIQPSVEALDDAARKQKETAGTSKDIGSEAEVEIEIEDGAEFAVRVENGLGEWFGSTTFFNHPTPPSLTSLIQTLPRKTPVPFILDKARRTPILYTSPRGESIPQLHARLATTLAAIIAEVDAEITQLESALPAEKRTSKAILICSHAAPLIAIGRVLTGRMPEDVNEEDFHVYTAGLSTFRRRGVRSGGGGEMRGGAGREWEGVLAPGTRVMRAGVTVPDWEGGKGVGGGWDCVVNGDCSFLSGGAERGWHFNGEESFDTGLMAEAGVDGKEEVRIGTKL
ncbi:histidine phosphatase superfamily [Aspergillus egyptiacus]|nr:histidine phosphatase superfamily [Aspergillus egyptiacus]